jgi:hypothetical protein
MTRRITRGTALVLPAVLLTGMLALAAAAGAAVGTADPCAAPSASADPIVSVSADPIASEAASPSMDPSAVPSIDPSVSPSPDPLLASTDPVQTRSKGLVAAEPVPSDSGVPTPSPCPDASVAPLVEAMVIGPTLTVVPDPHALVYGDAAPLYTFTLVDNAVAGAPVTVDPTTLTTYVAPICSTEHTVIVPPANTDAVATQELRWYTPTTSVAESPLTITCTGGSAVGYAFDVTTTAELTIAKKATTITAPPTAGDIAYGQTLHDSTLTGGSGSVPGYFTFPPDSWSYTPQVGTQSHAVAFVPDQFADYEPIATPVNVTVTQAAAVVITPPTASPLVTGQTLASSVLTGGVASTEGTFAFTSPATAPADGTAAQQVTFTPADLANFTPTTVNVDVTVAPAPLHYTVTGYLGRVQMGAVTNMVRPRVMVPLAFTITDGATPITDVRKVTKFDPVAISCEAIIDNPTEVFPSATIGRQSRLVYDAADGRFVQFWKVPVTRNTCYQVTTTIDHGDPIVAYFKTW